MPPRARCAADVGGLILLMLIGPGRLYARRCWVLFFALSRRAGVFGVNYLPGDNSRIFGNVLSNELLLAVPVFTLLERSFNAACLDEDMLRLEGQLVGYDPRRDRYSVIIVGLILVRDPGTVARGQSIDA